MINPRFEKEAFKKEVEQNVKTTVPKNCRRSISSSSFIQAVSYVGKRCNYR